MHYAHHCTLQLKSATSNCCLQSIVCIDINQNTLHAGDHIRKDAIATVATMVVNILREGY